MAKVFITKYAATKGILEMEGEINPMHMRPDTLMFRESKSWNDSFYMGREAFENREDAVKNANKRIKDKIASLQKQMAKLEKIKFE